MLLEENTIQQIKAGNIAAFKSFFDSVYYQLYFYCRKYISDPEDAKDLLQNVFMKLWEKREELEIHTSLESYIYRSVHNECLNYIRCSRPTDSIDENIDNDDSPYQDLTVHEIESIVEETVRHLPQQCQSIFRMSRIQGLRNQEIAEQLYISVRTVETQIYRALKILKIRLKDYII